MRRDIAVEETLPFPVETVWQALTDPEALAEWVMPVEGFAPVVGQRFRFKARPMPGRGSRQPTRPRARAHWARTASTFLA
jgi:uncharacterized protein YndB with AHSA1/START domain